MGYRSYHVQSNNKAVRVNINANNNLPLSQNVVHCFNSLSSYTQVQRCINVTYGIKYRHMLSKIFPMRSIQSTNALHRSPMQRSINTTYMNWFKYSSISIKSKNLIHGYQMHTSNEEFFNKKN